MRKTVVLMALGALALLGQSKITAEKEAAMKADLAGQIDAMKKQAQVMVDSVFSFGELGFQEFETSKYLTGILEKEGFKIQRGVAGIPTAWVASWGSGKPVISRGDALSKLALPRLRLNRRIHDQVLQRASGRSQFEPQLGANCCHERLRVCGVPLQLKIEPSRQSRLINDGFSEHLPGNSGDTRERHGNRRNVPELAPASGSS